MVVMEVVTEEERSAELYVSVHTFLKTAKSYLMLPNVFGFCALAFDIYVRITLSRFEQ